MRQPGRSSPRPWRRRPRGAYAAVLKPIEGTILTVVREQRVLPARPPTPGSRSPTCCARPGRRPDRPRPDARPASGAARTPASSTPGERATCCCSTLPCTSSTANRCRRSSPTPARGVVGAAFEAVAHRTSGVDGELDVSEQRYEVMFLCHLDDSNIEALKHGWGTIGDSIVVVGGDGIVELPRAHERHRRGDRDGARPRRPTVPDPGHRPVRGGRRRARQPRGGARRRRWARPPTPTPTSSSRR